MVEPTVENGPEFFAEKENIPLLPDWHKLKNPFEKIAPLNMDKGQKDAIVLWWKNNPRNLSVLEELKKVADSVNIPPNESSEISGVYNKSLEVFKEANQKLLSFLSAQAPGGVRKILNLYANILGASKSEELASEIYIAIDDFKTTKADVDLYTAIGKAIAVTRAKNPDERKMRQKVAQSIFEEIFNQMAIDRIEYVHDIDDSTSKIIDSPESERIDLTSALLAEPWNGDTRRKMLKQYHKMKRVMDRLETDTEYKIAFNTLWKWANGEVPKSGSVFKILEYGEQLNEGLTDTVSDAWYREEEMLEDERDTED